MPTLKASYVVKKATAKSLDIVLEDGGRFVHVSCRRCVTFCHQSANKRI